MNMLAYHLTGIDILTGIDEELAAILQLIDGVSEGIAGIHGDHGTIDAALDLALVRLILLEAMGHDGLALRGGEHIGTQTDDAA